MPAAHSMKITAPTRSRLRNVARQLSEIGSLTSLLQGLCNNRRGGRLRWHDALDDDGSTCLRCDKLQAVDRHLLDALRRSQRFDLEAQMPVDFFFVAALLLHLLHAIAVLQQLYPLPTREQQHA